MVAMLLLPSAVLAKDFNEYSQDTTPATTDLLLKSAAGAGTTYMTFEHLFDLEDVIGKKSFEDEDWGDVSVSSNVVTIDSATLQSIMGLTETNGGIPYGTADNAYAWLAAGATGKVLIAKGAAAPEWTPYTFPATVPTVGKVLISDGTNLIGSTALGTGAYATITNYATLADPTFTGTVVLPNSQTLVTPVLGTPTSGTLTNCTGLPTAGISDANAGTDITADLEEEAHASEHEVGGADLIDNIPLTASPASNYGASGLIDVMTIDASAGSTYGSCLHIDTDGEWVKADANSINTMPCMGLAIEDGVGSKQILRHGRYRYDTWSWTVGGYIYVGETVGALTQTAPTTSAAYVQIVGIAETANIAFFFFDSSMALLE